MVGFVSPPVLTLTSLKPTVSITIGVDTGAVAAAGEGPITSGVYMMDNKIRNGSTNEGQINLHTNCNITALIGFQALPINAAGSGSDTVKIKSFALVSGDDVFTGAGHPIRIKSPPAGLQPGAYWIGQAMAAGTETYQIEIEVTVGELQPVKYFVTWNATITAS